ncbi:Regulatory protein TetR [uncultured Mycobacterium sp.]|uniref:Regulatory protein TetR n=1 Tax=uncultured Mycobacterium sp. TaxID=171292 RepID=A0A1Y5PQX1_9MYCO|nr:Regulatory protein TetR [uncultured Mycobacterium sp.]
MTQARPYGGIDAADRLARRRAQLLRAGLELLGSDVDPAELTVRGICREAGVATRYFYESFTDKDEFVAAVFDWVVAELAATTQAAVATAPADVQNRAAMANIVRTIELDPRVGRLMFGSQLSNATVVRKRQESGALFAMLSGQHVEATLRRPANDRIKAFAHFIVGGVGQTISAWLGGAIKLTADELVDQLTAIIDDLGEPRLFRD